MYSLAKRDRNESIAALELLPKEQDSVLNSIGKLAIFSVGFFCSISPMIAVSVFALGLWHFAYLGWLPFDRSHRGELIWFRWGIITLLACNIMWNAFYLSARGIQIVSTMTFLAFFLGSKGLEVITHLILAHANPEELAKLDTGFTARALSMAVLFLMPFIFLQGVMIYLRKKH